jgi:hypothetical protein
MWWRFFETIPYSPYSKSKGKIPQPAVHVTRGLFLSDHTAKRKQTDVLGSIILMKTPCSF